MYKVTNIKLITRAHWVYKCSLKEKDFIEFKRLRAICVFLTRKCRREYIRDIQDSLHNDAKKFWHFTNNLKHSLDLPSSVFRGDKFATSNSQSAKLFASFFQSFYTSQNLSPVMPIESPILTHSLPITITEVFEALNKINTTSSAGPDGILALFLKNCCNILAAPLHHIFNCSLDQGHFPSCWKSSYLKPILKSGDPHDITNYRPIAVLCACA